MKKRAIIGRKYLGISQLIEPVHDPTGQPKGNAWKTNRGWRTFAEGPLPDPVQSSPLSLTHPWAVVLLVPALAACMDTTSAPAKKDSSPFCPWSLLIFTFLPQHVHCINSISIDRVDPHSHSLLLNLDVRHSFSRINRHTPYL